MVSAADVQGALREGLDDAIVNVVDISGGCGSSFEVFIISPQFEGKRLLQRHQLVNAALAGLLGSEIHALSIKCTKTPAEAAEAAKTGPA